MADDIRLVIGVEQSGLLKAITNTESLESKVKKLSAAYARDAASYGRYNKAIGDLAKATKRNKKELLDYGKALRADEKATKKASDQVKAFTLARKQATEEDRRRASEIKKATQESKLQSAEEERLKSKFVAGHNAMNIYTKELNDLSVARRRGIISTKEQSAAVAQLNAQMKAGTGVFANAATGMRIVGKRANRTGVLAQQAGYQFGDFAVQVQSGTNPMIAFGQQATQLIGTFSMLARSTKAIMAFSALGVIVPVITAIAGAFMRMKSEAKDAEISSKELQDRLKSLTVTLQEYGRVQEAIKLGLSVEFVDASKGIKQSEKDLVAAEEAFAKIQDTALAIAQGGGIDISRLWTDPEGDLASAKKAVDKAKKLLTDLRAKEADENEKLHNEEMASRNSVVASIQQEARFQGALFGMTSKGQERANELRAFQNKLIEAGIKPMSYQYAEALKYFNQMVQNREATVNQTKAIEDAAKAQEMLSSTGSDYETQLLIVNAQIEALKEGKNAEVAAFLEGERLKVTAIYETAKALHTQTGNVIALAEASLIFLDAMSSLDSLAAARGKLSGLKSPDSPNGSKDKTKDPLADLKARIKLDQDLLGVSEARATVLRAIADSDVEYTDKAINGAVLKLEAYNKEKAALEEIDAQQKALAETIDSSMGTAFMSIIDGTMSVKDAFKQMAADIIKELMRVYVVQQMVNAAKMFFGFADGGAFSGGSQIQAYADGGVVGSPTTFPMAGGKTGLMGEAGPEAIMPLKRGANGKLGVQMEGGGGQSVVINQSFNFQANGDDSVKKLIAQAAPQIANLTKKSMLDDRRRGGQMKATFG